MEENRDIKDHIVAYFLEGDNRDVSDPVLIEWLQGSESNKKIFSQYEKIWRESTHYITETDFDTELAWAKINHINHGKEASRKRIRRIYYFATGIAASLLILFTLSSIELFNTKSDILVSMTTEYGNRSEVVLPDGSIVQLNTGSEITYSYNSKNKVREISFQGEGFFDVSKSKTPFIVTLSNGLKVKVLGTSFNLSAYPGDQIIKTSLVEGSIELNHEENSFLMKAGEMVVFDRDTEGLKRTEGIISHSYGWLENKLYMDNMSLADVCKYLERNYDVRITLQQELGDSIHYNGVIQEETIIDVMDALSRLSHIKYEIKGKKISITSK